MLFIPAVILFFVVVAGAVGISGDDDASTGAAVAAFILYAILISLVWLLYSPLLMMREGEHNGQTLGKQLVGIRVVRDNGQRMSFGWAALRGGDQGPRGGHRLVDHPSAALAARRTLAALGRPEQGASRHDRPDARDPRLTPASGGHEAQPLGGPVQIISSRPGPTPIMTTGMPRKSATWSRYAWAFRGSSSTERQVEMSSCHPGSST